jgi:hypothetical protein
VFVLCVCPLVALFAFYNVAWLLAGAACVCTGQQRVASVSSHMHFLLCLYAITNVSSTTSGAGEDAVASERLDTGALDPSLPMKYLVVSRLLLFMNAVAV